MQLATAGVMLLATGYALSTRSSFYTNASFWTSSPTWFAMRVGILMAASPRFTPWPGSPRDRT